MSERDRAKERIAELEATLWRERDQHTRDHQRLMEQCQAWEASSMEQGARCVELESQLAACEKNHRAMEWMRQHPFWTLSIHPTEPEGDYAWTIESDFDARIYFGAHDPADAILAAAENTKRITTP